VSACVVEQVGGHGLELRAPLDQASLVGVGSGLESQGNAGLGLSHRLVPHDHVVGAPHEAVDVALRCRHAPSLLPRGDGPVSQVLHDADDTQQGGLAGAVPDQVRRPAQRHVMTVAHADAQCLGANRFDEQRGFDVCVRRPRASLDRGQPRARPIEGLGRLTLMPQGSSPQQHDVCQHRRFGDVDLRIIQQLEHLLVQTRVREGGGCIEQPPVPLLSRRAPCCQSQQEGSVRRRPCGRSSRQGSVARPDEVPGRLPVLGGNAPVDGRAGEVPVSLGDRLRRRGRDHGVADESVPDGHRVVGPAGGHAGRHQRIRVGVR